MAEDGRKRYSGSCLCGAVRFEAVGLKDIWCCHCRQCRSITGHYLAAAAAKRENVTVDGDVSWTTVSENAAYGFCPQCKSLLFWRHAERPTLSVAPGNLDDAVGLDVKGHVFIEEKGEYYEITDGLPQYCGYREDDLR
ncbi:MAG: GFA family protein [Parvularculaceae bacterium]